MNREDLVPEVRRTPDATARSGPWRRFTVVLAVVLVAATWVGRISGSSIENDAEHNLLIAYNLAYHGIYSRDTDPASLTPTNIREPVPIILLAGYLGVSRWLGGDSAFEDLRAGAGARAVKWSNIPWAALLTIMVFVIAARSTGSTIVGILAIVATNWLFTLRQVDSLYTELHAAALLLVASYALMRAWTGGEWWRFLVAGVAFGLLALTKAAFFHITIGLTLLLAVAVIVRRVISGGRAAATFGVLVIPAGLLVVTGPWLVRNYSRFGAFQVSERGGVVLLMRATKSLMTWTEYRGSFYVWAPRGRRLVGAVLGFGPEDLRLGGRLQRLNRSENSDFYESDLAAERAGRPEDAVSYYRKARAERTRMIAELTARGHSSPEAAADSELQRMAVRIILAHPFRYAAATIPFLWRGAAFVFPVLMAFALYSAMRRRADLLFFVSPALMMVAFYAAATHNLPRYSAPAVPVAIVGGSCIVWEMVRRRWARTPRWKWATRV